MPFVCLVPVRLLSAFEYGGIVPHQWIAAKRLAALVFYSQDIVDDYFPAQPTAKISSVL